MPELNTHQTETGKPQVDFNQWSELARTDPDAFEARRTEVIEDMIQRLPEHKRERMRCLQWKIDQIRNQANNPMAACIKLSEMMWDSLVGPGGLKDMLERIGDQNYEPLPKAKVLEFQPAR